jgi:hypothetical protein
MTLKNTFLKGSECSLSLENWKFPTSRELKLMEAWLGIEIAFMQVLIKST